MVKIGKGINMEAVRNSNREAVLSYLNMYGASSRKKIAEDLKLTTATLSIITNELINNNLVLEIGELEEGKVGRKKILIDLNEKARYSLGLEIQKRKIIFVITDLKANIIFEKEWIITEKFENVDFYKILDFIKEKILPIKKIVLGIGILVQGEIKENKAISCLIPNIFEIVKDYLEIETFIENNMTGLVISELYFKEKYNNFWVLKYGPGVGTSVVVNGKILYGTDNKPVEFGHIPLIKTSNNIFCPICKKRGCLESEIHFDRIVEQFEKKGFYKKKDETDINFIERVSEKEEFKTVEKNINILAEYFSIISWTIPVNQLVLTGEIFLNEKFLEYFIEQVLKNKANIKKENITYMKNYAHKRKVAGCLLVLKKFFK
ncbi:ROK family protein [Fusobacterium sp.]|uniref:ROK family protein n=1 Tax=Fusobacterium sp. TaxID=68766 RepID=UPI00260D409C|nr:ROK family protein [Fusobacterium sp.]